MKLLSVAIPCYNSAEYMRYCIESLLPGGEEVEILIVNDGSSDKTAEIADAYEAQYPTIVKAIHQENGGHGQAVNTGIQHASGLYFKVVDSDDWVEIRAYLKILETLRKLTSGQELIDAFLSNFVYEKVGAKYKKTMKYDNVMPENRVFTWDEVGHFRKGQYILMHSVIYRTALLHECGLELPKHTFYVDNLYVFTPLEYVKKMYYMDVDFYRYFIGREDQSVQEQVMIKRIDQQIKVNKLMIETAGQMQVEHEALQNYLLRHLEIVTVVSAILLIRSGTVENLAKKKELMDYVKEHDFRLYKSLKYGVMGRLINLPGRAGRKISVGAYKISQRLVGFN
ncbi:glycosyltransferase family 2 protein [Gracilibacillus sp. S3-1-1]|uniref:Glycosyltransferase family 2 protein n=1 Tax=Gracilibacillus pellucidus TaxID=3095368 RepID=A0ACC6M329_9BACI|nr:glycosyltransferase family 2 protein [Gracilibacillus sp. S3-1-1]MDX8045275.1 glycosyltransferase family 2 protein [Gracilibacillus sp. S3-1-1]